ncbi:MAG: ATP-binding protein [Methanobacteriota archaeon]|nr:MAG: ATP-binding protein [Euryarchaeota archaeon]
MKKEIAPNVYSPISAQVFEIISFNLLINAIEASAPKKELTITLGCEDPSELCLTIADQGPGIPREIQDKVFTPFFTTKSTGTGLGLSTVYRLVNDCGGSLELQSSPEGTRISIKLPAIPEPKPPTETLE